MAENSPLQNFINDNLPAMITGYKQAIYFTETEKDGITHESPISSELEAKIATECESFLSECWKYGLLSSDFDAELLGHNFWLNRNGHGSGFWDSEDTYGENQAILLSKLAHSYGETWVYLGNDGQIWD